MHVHQILSRLESDNSRLYKEQVLRTHKDNELLREVMRLTFDPYTTFGIAKLPKLQEVYPTPVGAPDEVLFGFLEFLKEELATRNLTGNAARDALTTRLSVINAISSELATWCGRIVLRNLRCGVQVNTINKIWPGTIKEFKCQLAESLKTRVDGGKFEITQALNYPVSIQPKLDGLRCLAIKDGTIITMMTRSGSEIETAPKIKADLLELLHEVEQIVLDGELLARDWNETDSIVMSTKTKKDDDALVYNVFDCIDLEAFKAGSSDDEYVVRRKRLENLFEKSVSSRVIVVPEDIVNSEEELRKVYEKRLDEGHEGVMVKKLAALYEGERSDAMLKLKPIATYEGVIVGHFEGREGTKREGLFAGFEIILANGVITQVGGGFTDVLKAEIQLNDPDSYIGKIVEAEGQPPLTPDGRIRFPVFSRFRDARDVDSTVIDAFVAWTSH